MCIYDRDRDAENVLAEEYNISVKYDKYYVKTINIDIYRKGI